MELVLTQTDFEPLPRQKRETFEFKNEGLLTSTYKEKTRNNFFHSNPDSIYGNKQRIKSWQYGITSNMDTILKLSVFVIALAVALN